MAGSPILVPSPSSPEYNTAQRLAQLEQRVAILERQQSLRVEVFQTGFVTAGDTESFLYNWGGGRLWLVWGGFGTQNFSADPGAGVRAKIEVNGSPAAPDLVSWSETINALVGLGMVSKQVDSSLLVLGDNTITVLNTPGSSGGFVTCSIIVIEWPYA